MRPGVALFADRDHAKVTAPSPWRPAFKDVVQVRVWLLAHHTAGLLAELGDSLKVALSGGAHSLNSTSTASIISAALAPFR